MATPSGDDNLAKLDPDIRKDVLQERAYAKAYNSPEAREARARDIEQHGIRHDFGPEFFKQDTPEEVKAAAEEERHPHASTIEFQTDKQVRSGAMLANAVQRGSMHVTSADVSRDPTVIVGKTTYYQAETHLGPDAADSSTNRNLFTLLSEPEIDTLRDHGATINGGPSKKPEDLQAALAKGGFTPADKSSAKPDQTHDQLPPKAGAGVAPPKDQSLLPH